MALEGKTLYEVCAKFGPQPCKSISVERHLDKSKSLVAPSDLWKSLIRPMNAIAGAGNSPSGLSGCALESEIILVPG